ncbi:MAG: hypothetical protein ACK6AD_09890 [Cyanobacteriota bacterium]
MDWLDGDGGLPSGETRVRRGRVLPDGLSGSRPGGRSPGPGGTGRLDGLGRWVEGKLDWLLDDREDWREPWQEVERAGSPRGGGKRAERRESGEEAATPARPARRPRLEAISRRGTTAAGAGPADARRRAPVSPPEEAGAWSTPDREGGPVSDRGTIHRAGASTDAGANRGQDWPEEDSFTVPRWRRQEPPPRRPSDPLAPAVTPAPPPGRPLPRSTRRR